MPLEQDLLKILIIGFIVIILVMAISTIALWARNKGNNMAYAMISVHLILISIAFYFFMNAITLELDYNHPMASEENSLQLGFASVFWTLSMISLLIVIFKFSKEYSQA